MIELLEVIDQLAYLMCLVYQKSTNTYRAKLAEQVELHYDKQASIKSVIDFGAELSNQERNLLSVAHKNVVVARRSSWRVISSIEQKTEGGKKNQQLAKEYRVKVKKELRVICNDVLNLLDKYLIPKARNTDRLKDR